MMFWRLRGPSLFVDGIEDSVRNGLNVVTRFPLDSPPGLELELRDRLHSVLEWTTVDACRGAGDPIEVLRLQTCAEHSAVRVRSMNELSEADFFQGRLIWISNIERQNWSRWADALLAYAEACRNVDLLNRTLFLVTLSGRVAAEDVPEEVALVCRDYRGVVDYLDLFVFALWNASANIHDPKQRALVAHTVAHVAQWDFFLAKLLLSAETQEALYPVSSLCNYARCREWTGDTPKRWDQGTVDGGGETIVHSALLAISGELRQVRQRIWAGQAGVLLPLIEERRVSLVPECRRYLDLPVEIEGLAISDPFDIEVGQLARLLVRTHAPPTIRKQVRLLRDARNKLAHMEPLDASQARFLIGS